MLNHTYTSVKNANLVDCGKRDPIPSQPFPLLRDNYLGEYRTELDKKRVLANLGIATELSLEWEYIKGDIGRSVALMLELDSRTKYVSKIDGFTKTLLEGILYLETVVGSEQEDEEGLNNRLKALEEASADLESKLVSLRRYIQETVDVNIETLQLDLELITEKVNNITSLILVSSKSGNALVFIPEGSLELAEGLSAGLYVADLSVEVTTATLNIELLQGDVEDILNTYVTKELLGGGDFDFVDLDAFDNYISKTDSEISGIKSDLSKTVKTGEDGHVDTLFVNKISKNNNNENILITDSFKVDSGIPLDVRFVVDSIEELHSLDPTVCYAGMGVIVKDQASLYILRNPVDGIINEDYILDKKNINWKCPEDLVIEVLTLEEYDKKVSEDSINPNMFYYIYEEDVEEPLRSDFESKELYEEAYNKWLRILQQQYMSGVWGKEIEELVSGKASRDSVETLGNTITKLQASVETLSGGETDTNLKKLNEQVLNNKSVLDSIVLEGGTISDIRSEILELDNKVVSDYVAKNDITIDNPEVEYIFLKKTAFEEYKNAHALEISKLLQTGNLTTDLLTTSNITIGDNSLTSLDESLLFNDLVIALHDDIPVIEVLDAESFNDLLVLDDDTYYYVYDTNVNYITSTEFQESTKAQSETNKSLSGRISTNESNIGNKNNLTTVNKNDLVSAVNELNDSLSLLLENVGDISKLPNEFPDILEFITHIYSKLSDLTTKVDSLELRIISLESN